MKQNVGVTRETQIKISMISSWVSRSWTDAGQADRQEDHGQITKRANFRPFPYPPNQRQRPNGLFLLPGRPLFLFRLVRLVLDMCIRHRAVGP